MVADDGWNGPEDGYIVTSKTELHDRTYHAVREATNELNADLVCAARNRAADALDSCAEWSERESTDKLRRSRRRR